MNPDETDMIEAARGYYEAFLAASPDLVRRHFLPKASKTGVMYDYEQRRFTDTVLRHDFDEIIQFASQYNASGHMPRTDPKIAVLDAQDHTAVVKLTAEWAKDRWGTDYVLLVRSGDRWLIAAVAWQSTV